MDHQFDISFDWHSAGILLMKVSGKLCDSSPGMNPGLQAQKQKASVF